MERKCTKRTNRVRTMDLQPVPTLGSLDLEEGPPGLSLTLKVYHLWYRNSS